MHCFYNGASVGTLDVWTLSASGEPRKLGCHKNNVFGIVQVFCVGHSGKSTHPDEMVYLMNGTYGERRYFGGDLNKDPISLPAWYSGYHESDISNHWTFNTKSSTRRKLDYLFVSKNAFRSAGRVCDANFSDHCYISASFGVPA